MDGELLTPILGIGTYCTDGWVRVGCGKRFMNTCTSSGISALTGSPRAFPPPR